MVCGSAPIDPEVLDFLSICFSCPIIEGYGQTESAAAVYLMIPGPVRGGFGAPLPCSTIRLRPAGELRGKEICYKSDNSMNGYFNNEKANSETIDEEGYIATGDVA